MGFADILGRYLTPSIAEADAQSLTYGATHPGSGPMDKLRLERPDLTPPVPLALQPSDPARSALSSDYNLTLAAVGNANAGPLFRKPGPSLKDRILEGIQGGMAGLAAASPSSDTSFLPSMARAFTGTAEHIDQGRRDAFQRQLQAQMLSRQQTMDTATLDREGAQADYYRSQAHAKEEPPRQIPTTIGGQGYAFNPATGQYGPPQTAAPAPKLAPPRNIDPLSAEGVAAAARKAAMVAGANPGKPVPPPKPSISAETAYGIYPALVDADHELDTVAGTSLGALVSHAGIAGGYLLTPAQRQYNAAVKDFGLQYTTAVHGKRVNPEVTKGIISMLSIEPGDDPSTIQAKVHRRKVFLKAAETMQRGAKLYHDATENGSDGAAPTEQQSHWDALAQQFGEAETVKQIGPRP